MLWLKWFVIVLAGVVAGDVREKRTLDFVLRSVADAFGYDVQKRPSVLPLAGMQPPKPSSTFFPPPVKPLPPMPRLFPLMPRPTMAVAQPAKPMPAPAAPPRAAPPAPAASPRAVPATAPAPSPSQKPAPPGAPARPAQPGAPARPAQPGPPARPAPAPAPRRVSPPPLLTENVRKTFNIAFNFNRDVQTQAPLVRAPSTPPPAPSQKPPQAPPGARNPAPPPPPAARNPVAPPPPPPAAPRAPPASRAPAPPASRAPPPQPQAPAPPPPAPRAPAPAPTPRPPRPPKRAELYQNYPDYYDSREKYQNIDPVAYDYDLTNGQAVPAKDNYNENNQRFKDSLQTFWKGSPWIQQQGGYKYLTPAPPPPPTQPQNKYEEYEIEEELPQRYREEEAKYAAYDEIQPQNEREEYYVETNKGYQQNPQEQESNNQINYANQQEYQKQQPQPFKPEPDNQQRNQEPPIRAYLSEADQAQIFAPEGSNQKAPIVKIIRRPVNGQTATVSPQFAGVLPVSLHQLTDKERSPWPLPFDADYAASVVRRVVRQSGDFSYLPESYKPESSYEPPEPEAVDYKALERLTNFDDSDKELSDNARVTTSQSGKKVTLVTVNKGTTELH